jgi:hypothetical protein
MAEPVQDARIDRTTTSEPAVSAPRRRTPPTEALPPVTFPGSDAPPPGTPDGDYHDDAPEQD